jgi:spermidine synthase
MTQNQELTFNADNIVLKHQPDKFVMMAWETDLMQRHAQIATRNHGHVLEIGFGMGISAQFIQDFSCITHTIVESHPDILIHLQSWAADKPNVRIINGDWFEMQHEICNTQYDGIFYDADCNNSPKFRDVIVDKTLKINGVFTYFAPNGTDKYEYGDALQRDVVTIQVSIPKNAYHNDATCSVPYFINS